MVELTVLKAYSVRTEEALLEKSNALAFAGTPNAGLPGLVDIAKFCVAVTFDPKEACPEKKTENGAGGVATDMVSLKDPVVICATALVTIRLNMAK